jgi:hypothetical protein
MALNQILSLLTAQRRALLDQLEAIDEAIAAVHRAEAVAAPPAGVHFEPQTAASPAAGPAVDSSLDPVAADVIARRVTPRRALSDEHKQALAAGARKAREAREVAKGAAREALGDAFVPAVGTRSVAQAPRLVKKPR